MPDNRKDPVDTRILSALQRDGRLTNQALADEVGLSPSPCWRRVNALEESGVIAGYGARLDRRRIGLGVMAFIRVRIEVHAETESDEFARAARRLPQVIACYAIAGDADFLLQVVAPDLDAYGDFAMNTLRRLPRIKEMQTSLVLDEIKPFTGFPPDLGG